MNNEGLSVKVAFDITKEIVSVTIAGDTTINVTRDALHSINNSDICTLLKLDIDPLTCMVGFTSTTGFKSKKVLRVFYDSLDAIKTAGVAMWGPDHNLPPITWEDLHGESTPPTQRFNTNQPNDRKSVNTPLDHGIR